VASTDVAINALIANATNTRLSVPVATVEHTVKQIENRLSSASATGLLGTPPNTSLPLRAFAKKPGVAAKQFMTHKSLQYVLTKGSQRL